MCVDMPRMTGRGGQSVRHTQRHTHLALSVSISAIACPGLTVSPALTFHWEMVPLCMVGLRAGIDITSAMCACVDGWWKKKESASSMNIYATADAHICIPVGGNAAPCAASLLWNHTATYRVQDMCSSDAVQSEWVACEVHAVRLLQVSRDCWYVERLTS